MEERKPRIDSNDGDRQSYESPGRDDREAEADTERASPQGSVSTEDDCRQAQPGRNGNLRSTGSDAPEIRDPEGLRLARRALGTGPDAELAKAELVKLTWVDVRAAVYLYGRSVPNCPRQILEEAVNEVYFVIFARSLHLFRGGSLRSYVRRIAYGVVRRYLHHRSSRWEGISPDPIGDETGDGTFVDPTPAADELLSLKRKWASFERIVAEHKLLTRREQIVVGFLLEHDLTPAEIAEAMGSSTSNVYVTLHLVKKKLLAHISPEYEE